MASTKPKTASDYHALATERGIEWLDDDAPINTRQKSTWRCAKGHIFRSQYSNIKNNDSGCPTCALERASVLFRKHPVDYHSLAVESGIEWIGPEVNRTNLPTGWRCPLGHEWMASYNNVSKHRDCRICRRQRNIERTRLTPDDYHALARSLGFEWLGPPVLKNTEYTNWRCSQGHVWETTYNQLQHGHDCTYCSMPFRRGDVFFRELAQERGFVWLGPIPKTSHHKTTWQCQQGHQWEAVTSNIKGGTGCPQCADIVNGARVSQVQRQLCEMLGGILNYRVGRYAIDVALQTGDINIGIEYDCWFWHRVHADKTEHERKRDKYLISQGWRILRVKANELLPSQEQLDTAITALLNGSVYQEIVLEDWPED